MSVYTCAATSQNVKPSNEFKERNINGVPCPIGLADVIAYSPQGGNVVYDTIIKDLPSFMECTNKETVTTECGGFFTALKDYEFFPTTEAPILRIMDVTSAEVDAFKEQGMTPSIEYGGKSMLGSPNLTQFAQIISMSRDQNNRSLFNVGEVGIGGYLGWIYAWRGAMFFSRASMAGVHPDAKQYILTAQDHTSEELLAADGINTVDESDFYRYDESVLKGSYHIQLSGSHMVLYRPIDDKSKPDVGVGLDHIPLKGGYLFPYFHGLITPDKSFLAVEFFRHYFRALAGTPADAAARLPGIRDGLRQLALSRPGMVLQHIYLGIRLAVDSQSGFQIIIHHNRYLGFILTGSVEVLQRGRVISPLNPYGLKEAIQSLSRHDAAVERILNMMRETPGVEGATIEVQPEDGATARSLADLLYRKDVEWLSSEKRSELVKLIDQTSYGEKYWPMTPENILIVIKAMTTGKWSHPEAPYYLGDRVAFSTNQFTRALAVFGPRAPSAYVGTQAFSLPRPGVEDSNLKVTDKVRHLQYIPFYPRPIHAASNDWSTVRARAQIAMNPPRKGKREFANVAAGGVIVSGKDEPFTSVYEALKEFVEVKRRTEATKGKGKKRAAEAMETDEAEGPSSKKPRVPLYASAL